MSTITAGNKWAGLLIAEGQDDVKYSKFYVLDCTNRYEMLLYRYGKTKTMSRDWSVMNGFVRYRGEAVFFK